MSFHNPLSWPPGWQRSEKRRTSDRSASLATTVKDLNRVCQYLKIESIQITSDHPVRVDGQLSQSSNAVPADPGVAIYFERNAQQLCIAQDSYNTVLGNLRSIGLSLDYISRMERDGTSNISERAFTGFKALPETAIVTPYQKQPWYDVLQVNQNADSDIVRSAYKRLIAKYHPDNQASGDVRMFHKIQDAWKESPHD